MAYYFTNRLHSVDALPKNFIHTFLLRDPQKSVCSLYKMSRNKDLTGTFRIVQLPHLVALLVVQTWHHATAVACATSKIVTIVLTHWLPWFVRD